MFNYILYNGKDGRHKFDEINSNDKVRETAQNTYCVLSGEHSLK